MKNNKIKQDKSKINSKQEQEPVKNGMKNKEKQGKDKINPWSDFNSSNILISNMNKNRFDFEAKEKNEKSTDNLSSLYEDFLKINKLSKIVVENEVLTKENNNFFEKERENSRLSKEISIKFIELENKEQYKRFNSLVSYDYDYSLGVILSSTYESIYNLNEIISIGIMMRSKLNNSFSILYETIEPFVQMLIDIFNLFVSMKELNQIRELNVESIIKMIRKFKLIKTGKVLD